MTKITVEIARSCRAWANHQTINKFLIKKIVRRVLSKFTNLVKIQEHSISILLTDDHQMASLNQQFLSHAKTTNVLSFPDAAANWQQALEIKPDLHYMYLGDVAFGYQVIRAEAESQNKNFEVHFTHLLVHSVLHLIGFDHQTSRDATIMENLEITILSGLAIPSPY